MKSKNLPPQLTYCYPENETKNGSKVPFYLEIPAEDDSPLLYPENDLDRLPQEFGMRSGDD